MAWGSVGSLGGTQSATANQSSLVLTTSATLEAGNVGVIIVAVDNHGTTDADHSEISGVVDSTGANTWIKAKEFTNGQGSAQAGVTVSLWYTKAGTQLTSGGTITVSFTNNTSRDRSAIVAWEFTIGAGNTVSVAASATQAVDGGDAASLDATTAGSGEHLRIRGIGQESNTTAPATTNTASWTGIPFQVTSGAGSAANIRVEGEFRIVTGTTAASNPTLPDTPDNASVYVALLEATGNQTLTPSLFTDAQTFYTQTVGVGAVGLTPSLFSNAQSFFTQTLASVYPITAALFTDADTFFTPTIGVGAVDLAAALFTDADTFFTQTVAATYALTPDLFTDGDTFFTPTVAVGAVTLTPSLFSNAQSFFTQTVAVGAVDLAAALFSNAQTFFEPTVTADGGTQDLTPDLFSNAQTFFTQTLATTYALTPPLFTDADTFYAATVTTGAVDLTPTLFTNTQIFFAPTVSMSGGGAVTAFVIQARRTGRR